MYGQPILRGVVVDGATKLRELDKAVSTLSPELPALPVLESEQTAMSTPLPPLGPQGLSALWLRRWGLSVHLYSNSAHPLYPVTRQKIPLPLPFYFQLQLLVTVTTTTPIFAAFTVDTFRPSSFIPFGSLAVHILHVVNREPGGDESEEATKTGDGSGGGVASDSPAEESRIKFGIGGMRCIGLGRWSWPG